MRSRWNFTSSSNLLFICLTTIGHLALICPDLYIPVSVADKHLSHPARYSDTSQHSRQFVQNHRLVVSHHSRYQSYHCRNDGHDVPLPSMLSQWLVSQQLRWLPCWLRTSCLFWGIWPLRCFFRSCNTLKKNRVLDLGRWYLVEITLQISCYLVLIVYSNWWVAV